jgi:xanthosine utilization system XapX-like protein
MKIYVLLMLVGVIVGFSYIPLRRPAKASAPMSPPSIAASV